MDDNSNWQMVMIGLTWAQPLLVSKTNERFVVDLGMQRRVLIHRELGADTEQCVSGSRSPLHADTALNLL